MKIDHELMSDIETLLAHNVCAVYGDRMSTQQKDAFQFTRTISNDGTMGTISTPVSMDVLLIAGGTMPSHSLLLNFQSSLQLVDQVTFDMI